MSDHQSFLNVCRSIDKRPGVCVTEVLWTFLQHISDI